MLNWPWVSRRAYDAVLDERDRLRIKVDGLTDDLVRLARVEHGLPEKKPAPRQSRSLPPLPENLRNLLSGFSNPIIAQQYEHEIRVQLRNGVNPDVLDNELRPARRTSGRVEENREGGRRR